MARLQKGFFFFLPFSLLLSFPLLSIAFVYTLVYAPGLVLAETQGQDEQQKQTFPDQHGEERLIERQTEGPWEKEATERK